MAECCRKGRRCSDCMDRDGLTRAPLTKTVRLTLPDWKNIIRHAHALLVPLYAKGRQDAEEG